MSQDNRTEHPMTLEEARKVRWLRQNPRPMGELVAEGYLTKKDLAWAAQSAFNPVQKQAAQVLLDALNHTPFAPNDKPSVQALPPELAHAEFLVNLTMEQARATEWPFSPYKGEPMGKLVDKQQITLRELGYAVDAAWDKRVRQAVTALLLTRLNQIIQEPAPSAGLLRVISGGRSFAERRQFYLVIGEAMLFGIVLGVLLGLWIAYTISALSSPPKKIPPGAMSPTTIAIGIGILVLLSVGALTLLMAVLDRIANYIEKQIRFYRKGQEGEDRVVAAMHAVLDGTWCLFRNVKLPGRNKGDLDSVLVGPAGVWVLEIKTFTNEHRNVGERWEYRTKNGWRSERKSPSRQAADNAARLSSFLKADSIQQWVTPAVVWANPEAHVQVDNPSVAVWTLDRLPDELGNIWQGESLAEPKRQQIVDKLTRLCKTQQEARNSA